jgi:hypothetical protein
MFCPNCLYEYEKTVKKCSDCGADLVDKLPKEDEGDPNIEISVLTDVDNDVESDVIRGMLEEKGVYSFLRVNILPSSNIILGGLFGKRKYGTIMVNKEELVKAKEVLEDYRSTI